MFKSLKVHQTLYDVLNKQILNKNPRKEGFGFTRNIENGHIWHFLETSAQNEMDLKKSQSDPFALLHDTLGWDAMLYSTTSWPGRHARWRNNYSYLYRGCHAI